MNVLLAELIRSRVDHAARLVSAVDDAAAVDLLEQHVRRAPANLFRDGLLLALPSGILNSQRTQNQLFRNF